MSSLALQTRRDGPRAIVALSGELDLATVPTLRDAALDQLGADDCTTLVLELSELTFLDSTGLGCWIDLRNRAEDLHKSLEFVDVPAAARRTVTIAGLAPLFGID